ncbi:zinc ribbon domain-containing protein [Paucilactobacillus suebicus]|nr:zinc ribbon domain-containing protein [Paucilactobacillus suebicus]
MEEKTKFCYKCGAKIPLNSEFCPNCGAKQSADASQGQNNPNQNNMQSQNGNQQFNSSQPSYSQYGNQPVQRPAAGKITQFMIWGWITCVVSLFFPITAVASVILGAFTIQRNHKAAGIILIVVAVIFFYLGMTGFRSGFMDGLNRY